ncbi:hypothetical protein SFR_1181 [Streptomyces sp. FR-008]|nr:hypothetical protein SFR_1181 [Streptomyces sp. FR-008]
MGLWASERWTGVRAGRGGTPTGTGGGGDAAGVTISARRQLP